MSSLPSPDALTARLVWRRDGATQVFRLDADTEIGRDQNARVRLKEPTVSRQHARIVQDGGRWWLEGLSPAGTFLNRQLVVGREKLRHLDVISLSRGVDLVFVLGGIVEAPPDRGIRVATLRLDDGRSYHLPLGLSVLGRGRASTVVIEDPAVSGVHAEIERTATSLVVRDRESANGTFVNDQRVTECTLADGDVIALARGLALHVALEYGEIEAPPEPVDRPEAAEQSEWRTRYEWDSGDMYEIARLQELIQKEQDEKRPGSPERKPGKP